MHEILNSLVVASLFLSIVGACGSEGGDAEASSTAGPGGGHGGGSSAQTGSPASSGPAGGASSASTGSEGGSPTSSSSAAGSGASSSVSTGGSSSSSPCDGIYACDPILDTGCPAGQHCMVVQDGPTKTVVCQASGTTPPEQFGGDCIANPCQPGYACFAALGFCTKVCDPTVGSGSLPGSYEGKPSSPDCTGGEKDCVAGSQLRDITCFGLCKNVL